MRQDSTKENNTQDNDYRRFILTVGNAIIVAK